VLDQRGHGHSPHPKTPYTYENYAADLCQLLDELKWSQINLVGHSMGGRVGLVFADLFPHRLETFVIEDITPSSNSPASLQIRRWLESVPVPFRSRAAAKKFLFGPWMAQFQTAKEGLAMANFFYTNIIDSERGAEWRFSLPGVQQTIEEGLHKDRWGEWQRVHVPTLVIRGERSFDLPRADWLEMLRRNPQARGVEIADAGHWVHFDQPEKFTQAVRDFLLAAT
jgi:pimeloyl-ACP methyl ester carboxylesterase